MEMGAIVVAPAEAHLCEDSGYRHIEDNSASHRQASAMGFSTFVFVEDGRLALGRWQTIYLAEFDGPRTRRVLVKVVRD